MSRIGLCLSSTKGTAFVLDHIDANRILPAPLDVGSSATVGMPLALMYPNTAAAALGEKCAPPFASLTACCNEIAVLVLPLVAIRAPPVPGFREPTPNRPSLPSTSLRPQ